MAGERVDSAEQHDELEHAAETISKDEGRRTFLLWFGVLGSPLAWFGHLGGNYSLEEWFACSRSTEHPGEILGLSVDAVSLIFNTAMALVAAASGLVAYRCWQALKKIEEPDNTEERARWMGFAGVVECALFLGIILLGYLPTLLVGTCETTP
jgi:hypothetical protein